MIINNLMIENMATFQEIRNFLSSGTEKAHEIEKLTMEGRHWPYGITHDKIKDKCAEILFYPTAIGWATSQDEATNTEQFNA